MKSWILGALAVLAANVAVAGTIVAPVNLGLEDGGSLALVALALAIGAGIIARKKK